MSQNQNRTFNLSMLAAGIAQAYLEGSLLGGLDETGSARLGGLFEAWGRLTDQEPPSPDEPDYEAKAQDLFARMLEDVLEVASDMEDVRLVRQTT